MKKLVQYIYAKPIETLMIILVLWCLPGLLIGVFNVGKEVGQTLASLF